MYKRQNIYVVVQYCFIIWLFALVVCLQTPGFNRGYWSDFEEFVRELVLPDSAVALDEPPPLSPPFKDVYVITGPLFLPSKEASRESAAGELQP